MINYKQDIRQSKPGQQTSYYTKSGQPGERGTATE